MMDYTQLMLRLNQYVLSDYIFLTPTLHFKVKLERKKLHPLEAVGGMIKLIKWTVRTVICIKLHKVGATRYINM